MLDFNKAYNPPCVPGTARDHLIGINGRHKDIIWLPGEPFGPSRGCCASPRNSERPRRPDPSSTPRESSPLTGDSAEFFGSLSSRGYRSPCSLRASLLLGAVLFDGQLAEFVASTSMGVEVHGEDGHKFKTERQATIIPMRRGDYGYDATYALVIVGLLAVGSGLGAAIAWLQGPIRAATPITIYFAFFLANTSSFLYATRCGKFLEWNRILDRLRLRGDEAVLDMGCGRGAVLTAVARRLTDGPSDRRRYLEHERSVGQREGRHPAQRIT